MANKTRNLPVIQDKPICASCGACCAFYNRYKNRCVPIDISQEKAELLQYTEKITYPFELPGQMTQQMKRTDDGNCIAHEGTVGKSSNCSIYWMRPVGCHTFDIGGDLCQNARAEYGLSNLMFNKEK